MDAILDVIALLLGIRLLFLIITVAIITWVVKLVWNSGKNRKYKKQLRQWKKYNRKLQKRKSKERITVTAYIKDGEMYSPTGWRWDEKAQLWIPPEK